MLLNHLWHWPLLSFQFIVGLEPASRGMRLATVGLSFVLAWVTYRLIERPIRFGGKASIKTVALCISMVVIGLVGFYTFEQKGFLFRLPELIQPIAKSDIDIAKGWREHECFLKSKDDKFVDACLDQGSGPIVFLWGDSHAAALYPGLKALQASRNFRIVQRTAVSCPPLTGWTTPWNNPSREFCREINEENLDLIKVIQPDIVLLHANWDDYAEDSSYLKMTLSALRKIGANNVIVIGPVPQWRQSLPRVIFTYYNQNTPHQLPPAYTRYGLVTRIEGVEKLLEGRSADIGLRYISALRAMCNDSGCLTRIGDDLTAFDYGHLSPEGSRFFINSIADNIIPMKSLLLNSITQPDTSQKNP